MRKQFQSLLEDAGLVDRERGMAYYNAYSRDWPVVRAALLAGLYPNVVSESCRGSGVWENGRVSSGGWRSGAGGLWQEARFVLHQDGRQPEAAPWVRERSGPAGADAQVSGGQTRTRS
jgi:hypothetical protein